MTVVFGVVDRQAQHVRETPYGSVGVLHEGRDLKAWWISKDQEDIDPEWSTFTREDFVYVVRGALKLEFRDAPERDVVVREGESYVIPARELFRGYRWPRDSAEPCLFVAISPADVDMTKALVTS